VLYSSIAQVYFVALLMTCGFVGLRGDGWGRASAVLHAVNFLLIACFQEHRPHTFAVTNFYIDGVGAVCATVIALASRRSWAACLAAFQWLGVANRLVRVLDPHITRQVSIAASYVWETGALMALTWAVRGKAR
jgi:hypothetical protein